MKSKTNVRRNRRRDSCPPKERSRRPAASLKVDLEATLRRVKAHGNSGPDFESAITRFAGAEAERAGDDPVEGRTTRAQDARRRWRDIEAGVGRFIGVPSAERAARTEVVQANMDGIQRSITACIENAKRLLEDAEWSYHQASTGLALALLAQEEAAKAFVLTLVRDRTLPWTADVHRSLSVHEGKHLVAVIMEWLFAVNEQRFGEGLKVPDIADSASYLPRDVATAMNIYRHEMIERIGRRYPERRDEWRGLARKLADGRLDRKKQLALYVHIGKDGSLASEPPTSLEDFREEMARATSLVEFAGNADRMCIFAFREYELFTEIFNKMFADLAPGAVIEEERFESNIPGVEFVKRTITVANVVDSDPEPST